MSEARAASWPERYAAALQARSGIALPAGLTAPAARAGLLDIARDVAHATERRNAPLATGLAGSYVTLRVAQGAAVETALAEAAEVAAALAAEPG